MPVVSAGHFKTMPVYGAESRTPTIRNSEIIKPQVNGLLYFKNSQHGLLVPIWPVNRHSF